MALVIGHNRINYLWNSLKEYTVFSFPEYKTLDFLKEEEIYQVAPFFSNVVLVVGANDICYKTPEKIVDDVLFLCNTIRYHSPSVTVHLSEVLPRGQNWIYNINTDNITVHIPDVQRQQNSHDCGVYAIAFVTELICSDFNVDISNTRFMTSLMRTHLLKCIEENKISVFPKVAKMPKMPCNEPEITKIKLYCKCKMPEFIDDMIGCDNKHCRKWFHKKCIFNSTTSCNNSNDNWLCSSCCW